jgi:adenylate cyclase
MRSMLRQPGLAAEAWSVPQDADAAAAAATKPAALGDAVGVIALHKGGARPIAGEAVADWLLGDGRQAASTAALFDELCWRLVGSGIPLWRATITLATLHPEVRSYGYRWWRERGVIEEVRVRHWAEKSDDYRDSPIRDLIERGGSVRYRLEDEASIHPFPLLQSLRRAGATDYFASPLSSFNGRYQVSTWTTDRSGGFKDEQLDAIRGLLPLLSTVAEGMAMRRLAGTLLDTYLGPTIGRRILAGEVQRGRGERLRAILMATDLRGFTSLSDRLPADALILLLDRYFDAVAGAIAAQGGEVLKFVGDGVLAIFPAATGEERVMASAALDAAEEILRRLAEQNAQGEAARLAQIRIGIGLHIGEVFYGNVGAATRLDFTAIGPAVNLVCRLEALTKRFGRPLLLSKDFAGLCAARPLQSLGFQSVKGLGEPEEVFGLADGPGAMSGAAT